MSVLVECRFSPGDVVEKNGKRYRIAYLALFPYADGAARYVVWEVPPTRRLKPPTGRLKVISENGLVQSRWPPD
jgi:hypothetical protein